MLIVYFYLFTSQTADQYYNMGPNQNCHPLPNTLGIIREDDDNFVQNSIFFYHSIQKGTL